MTSTNIIPAGATVEAVVGRVTQSFSNITQFRVDDGVTAGLFAVNIPPGVNNTFTQVNTNAGVWTGPKFFRTATNLVVTATGTFGFSGQLKVTIYYYTFTAHSQ
jgi:NADH:ubiquinone oxidoreductase subunit F (NADH-binding)